MENSERLKACSTTIRSLLHRSSPNENGTSKSPLHVGHRFVWISGPPNFDGVSSCPHQNLEVSAILRQSQRSFESCGWSSHMYSISYPHVSLAYYIYYYLIYPTKIPFSSMFIFFILPFIWLESSPRHTPRCPKLWMPCWLASATWPRRPLRNWGPRPPSSRLWTGQSNCSLLQRGMAVMGKLVVPWG